jgi:Tol biopolymer transport system component
MAAATSESPTTVISAAELTDLLMPRAPMISPDGTMVLIKVAPEGRKGKYDRTSLWIARGDEPARQLTAGTASDTGATWAPDCHKVAFLSDRAKRGTQRIYVLPGRRRRGDAARQAEG